MHSIAGRCGVVVIEVVPVLVTVVDAVVVAVVTWHSALPSGRNALTIALSSSAVRAHPDSSCTYWPKAHATLSVLVADKSFAAARNPGRAELRPPTEASHEALSTSTCLSLRTEHVN